MLGAMVRFVVSALVLMFVGLILPGFNIVGFINALLAAAAIAVVGYLIETILGGEVSPQNRGLVGFLTSAVVLWAVQFVVPEMQVTVIGALLAAVVIGVVDVFIPTALR